MLAKTRSIGGSPLRAGLIIWLLLLLVLTLNPVWGDNGSTKRLVSLDFVAADIHDVLKALSIQTGVNIVAGNDTKGLVTISLSNVTLTEALDYITKVSALGYQKEGNAYIVASPTSLKEMFGSKDHITEVIKVPNGHASEIQQVAGKALPNVGIQTQGEYLMVVSATPTDLEKIKDLVVKLDVPTPAPAGLLTETYRVHYIDPKSAVETLKSLVPDVKIVVGPNYGFGWYIKSDSSGGGGGDDKPKMDSDILVISGTAGQIASARAALAQIDKAPVQIMVEARVAIVDKTKLKSLGISWDWSSFTMKESQDNVTLNYDDKTGITTETHTIVNVPEFGMGLGRFAHNPLSMGATLSALLTNGNGKILASPKIATISNRPAAIFIGDKILYPVQKESNNTVTTTVESVDAGIGLKLAAIANDDGNITLCIDTYVSTIRDYLIVDKSRFPQISTREAQAAIRVKDGEEILIGGLLRDEDIKNIKKVPLLGDLPLIGNFFRDVASSTTQSEVLVFIKPKIVSEK